MKKRTNFASHRFEGWPRPEEIEHYFLAPPERRWFFETGDDGGRFDADGIDGTEARSKVSLILCAHPVLGVFLRWSKWDGKQSRTFYSKGDMARLRQLVRNSYSTPMPVGLLVPFETAWIAVKEFLETDGQLPESIEWIDDDVLPEGTFPDPHDPVVEERLLRDLDT